MSFITGNSVPNTIAVNPYQALPPQFVMHLSNLSQPLLASTEAWAEANGCDTTTPQCRQALVLRAAVTVGLGDQLIGFETMLVSFMIYMIPHAAAEQKKFACLLTLHPKLYDINCNIRPMYYFYLMHNVLIYNYMTFIFIAFRMRGLMTAMEEHCPVNGVCEEIDRKSTRLNSSHVKRSRMPSSA